MEATQILKKILMYNPIRWPNTGHLHLRWRDQHTLQEDRTDQACPLSAEIWSIT
jgi:hypothetical protein